MHILHNTISTVRGNGRGCNTPSSDLNLNSDENFFETVNVDTRGHITI